MAPLFLCSLVLSHQSQRHSYTYHVALWPRDLTILPFSFPFFQGYYVLSLGWTFSHSSVWVPSLMFSPLTLFPQD